MGVGMFAQISTLAFVGIEARAVEVQVQISPGLPAFSIVGLPDKAVAESRERVRAALHALGLGLPPKHITINLAPADLPKEGSRRQFPWLSAAFHLVPLDVVNQRLEDHISVIGMPGDAISFRFSASPKLPRR